MVTTQDFSFMNRMMAQITPDALPLRFQYGDRIINGWPDGVTPTLTESRADEHIHHTTLLGRMDDGLEIRLECVRYQDFPVVEYTAYLTNRGKADSKLLDSLHLSCHISGQQAKLLHGNGDTTGEDGYHWQQDALPVTLSPLDGTSCKGAFPYMRLLFPDGFISLAVGWPTQWEACFAQEKDGVHITAGQKLCHTVLHPGETIRTPRLTMQFGEGDKSRAINLWRRWYFAHVMPRRNKQPLKPLLCLHYWLCEGKPEFTAATEENQLHALHEYIRNGLTPDVWWIDAGWYPCDYVWVYTGTWIADAARFPHGLRVISDACRKHGGEMLLWFEPERVQAGTWLDENHPQWLLKRNLPDGSLDFDRLLNLGDKECCDALIDYVDAFIKENQIGIYRQDFNFNPEPFWRANEAENRIGMLENLHGQGYLRYWDGLLKRNPGLLIDSCASGGRRNDMESMRRAVPLHYTDVGYGHHPIKQLQHRQMFEWIPYFRAHNMNWDRPDGSYGHENSAPDEYAYHVALAPCITDMTPYDATPDGFALARRMLPVWRRAAEMMLAGDYYPLTECRADAHDFYGMQFHCEDRDCGFVDIVSNVCNPQTEFTMRLHALDYGAVYTLTSGYGDEVLEYSGAQLTGGVAVQLAPRSGVLYFYQKKACRI